MITLITGLPGSGKTLYTLCYVKALAEREGRIVHQAGISHLTLPWEILENPEKWYELPKGSIVVIDEAQKVFRPRGNASKVPDYVAELETHRHRGIDLFLITQHPLLIDGNVRRLVGQHMHSVRRFGTRFATIHEWQSCREINKASVIDAVKHEFRYPEEAFAWYRSAELHTHKRRVPFRIWFMLAAPLIVAGLGYVIYTKVFSLGKMPGAPADVPGVSVGKSVLSAPGSREKGTGGPPAALSSREYVEQYVPRVAGLAFSAPVYDPSTKVERAPVPVACAASSKRCQCYSQDATQLDVPEVMCRGIVEKGFFVPFAVRPPGGEVKQAGRRERSDQDGAGDARQGVAATARPEGFARVALPNNAAPSGGESVRGGGAAGNAPSLPQASPKSAP